MGKTLIQAHTNRYQEDKAALGPTSSSSIDYEPLGVSLVISAWNFPIYTSIPLVAASIAAGNCVIMKPSELSPETSGCIKKLFDNYLDKSRLCATQGITE